MRSRGNQDGGIALKMRELRALYKKAISREYVDKSLYPFEKYKLSHLKRKSHKRALSIQEFRLMRDFDTTFYPQLRHTHMYFLFSFYCRGINFTDLCLLKWSDIRGNHITYIRSKTKGKFSIEILPKVQEILDYFKEKFPDSKYIFPIILQENPTPIYLENRIKKTLQKFNRELKKIASIAGIETNITSYVIRHSYATLMKFSGISPQIISESMGHSNVEITNAYLKEFESEVIDEANRKLEDL
jgi:integrase